MVTVGPATQAAMVLAFCLVLVAVWALSRPRGAWGRRLRSRFLLGVPWGTLVVLGVVLAVYIGLQRGAAHRYDPLYLPFVSWSYRYPLGMLTAPFAHEGFGHLRGNLVGALVLAPLAEYAWSHFPQSRGQTSFSSWRTNPYVRAFVLFPLGTVLVAWGTAWLHWGPVVGFSGAVFAFAGFALVRYPLATVLALVARQTVGLALRAFEEPVDFAEASVQFTQPSWAGVAVLGHFLGLLLGALVGALVLRRRPQLPSAPRLAVGAALAATMLELWALWWYRGPASYVVYRAAGVAVVLLAAAALALVVRASDRPLVEGLSRRRAATLLFVVPLLVVAFVAVPVNFADVPAGSTPNADGAVSVRGYDVTYAEDVSNQRITGVNVTVGEETTDVRASGVIVVNDDREVWTQATPPGELDANRVARVRLGGLTWDRSVLGLRTGWNVVGNGSVYAVWLRADGGPWVHSFDSPASTARPVVAGRLVTVVHAPNRTGPATTGGFGLRVGTGNRSLGAAPMPTADRNTSAGGVTFVRNGETVVALRNDTRVRVASRETAA